MSGTTSDEAASYLPGGVHVTSSEGSGAKDAVSGPVAVLCFCMDGVR